MKKKILAMGIILIILCGGCQKTPSQKAVVSKAGGLDEKVIIDKLEQGENRSVDIPSQWNAEEERKNGMVKISVNLSLEPITISNTPVLEVKNKEFSNEELKKIVNTFSKGKKLYETQEKTKEELQVIKDRIDTKTGVYSNPELYAEFSQYSSNLAKMIEKAPESRADLAEVAVKFGIRNSLADKQRAYFFSGEEQASSSVNNYFRAQVGEDDTAFIRALCYDEEGGSTSNFDYTNGLIYSESEWRSIVENNEVMIKLKGEDSYFAAIAKPLYDKMKAAMDQEGQETEAGKKEVQKLLESLGINDMSLLSEEKALWIDKHNLTNSFYPEDDLWDFDWEKAQPAHKYVFTKELEGLPVDYKMSSFLEDTPEEKYTPPFGVEKIEIVVTSEGVQSFSWNNMAEQVEKIAENTKLISFQEIQDKLFDHLFYMAASETGAQNGEGSSTYQYNILSAKLGYTYTEAYQNPKHAWLVPTWFFTASTDIESGASKWTRPIVPVMINAINGGYIEGDPGVTEAKTR